MHFCFKGAFFTSSILLINFFKDCICDNEVQLSRRWQVMCSSSILILWPTLCLKHLPVFFQCQFLIQECEILVSKPNFSSILCYAIETPEHRQRTLRPSAQLLPNISRVLKLNKVQEVKYGNLFEFVLIRVKLVCWKVSGLHLQMFMLIWKQLINVLRKVPSFKWSLCSVSKAVL